MTGKRAGAIVLAAVLVRAMAGAGAAGPYQDALTAATAAFNRKDFAGTVRVTPLAEHHAKVRR